MWGLLVGLAFGGFVWREYTPIAAYLQREQSMKRVEALEATSNIIKAVVLLCLCTYSYLSGEAVRAVCLDRFSPATVQVTMAIYASLDVVSLMQVPKLARSTRIHHVGVGVVATWMLMCVDWSHDGRHAPRVAKCLFVYGLVSSNPYAVNGLLAVRRHISPRTRLRWVALVIYAASCAVNWTYQLYWLPDMHWSL